MFNKHKKTKNIVIFNIDNPFENSLFFSFLHSEHFVFASYKIDSTKSSLENKLTKLNINNNNYHLFKIDETNSILDFSSQISESNRLIDILFFIPNLYHFGNLNTINHSLHNNSLLENISFLEQLNSLNPELFSKNCKMFFVYNKNLINLKGFELNHANFLHLSFLFEKCLFHSMFQKIFFNHSSVDTNFWSNTFNNLPTEQQNHQTPLDLDISYYYNESFIENPIDHRIFNRILDISESKFLLKKRFRYFIFEHFWSFLKLKYNFSYSDSIFKIKRRFYDFKKNKKNKVH